jgi:hypothetical protein
MKQFEEIQNCVRMHKEELKENFRVKEIGIFGSYVRNLGTVRQNVKISKCQGLTSHIKANIYCLTLKIDNRFYRY